MFRVIRVDSEASFVHGHATEGIARTATLLITNGTHVVYAVYVAPIFAFKNKFIFTFLLPNRPFLTHQRTLATSRQLFWSSCRWAPALAYFLIVLKKDDKKQKTK